MKKEPIGIGSVFGNLKYELKKDMIGGERKANAPPEQHPERAFQNFKNELFEHASHEVRKEHLELFQFEKIENGLLKIRISRKQDYEFLQNNMREKVLSLHKKHFKHLVSGLSFVIDKKKRAYLDRVKSQQRLTRYLDKQEHANEINSGVATTARELLGLLTSFWNNQKPCAEQVGKLIGGKYRQVFRFSTSHSGFAASRKPKVRDKRTIKEHIDRLIKIGVLLEEQPDGQRRSRATTVWITFNPSITVYRY